MIYDDLGEYLTDPGKRNCFAEIWVESTLNLRSFKIIHWDLRNNAYQHPFYLMVKPFVTTKRATKNTSLEKVYSNNLFHNCYSKEFIICQQHIFSNLFFLTHWTHGNIVRGNIDKLQIFWLKKMHLKMLCVKWRPFSIGHISVITFCISSEIRLNSTRYP